jgi:phosphoserine phosphatase RsbU/P
MERGAARIALLLDSLETDYQLDIIQGAKRVAARAGARLLIVAGGPVGTAADPVHANFLYEQLRESRVDGILVLSGSLSNKCGVPALKTLLGGFGGCPMLTIGVNVDGVAGVSVDNRVGMARLVSHLIEEHGARRFAFVSGPEESTEAAARLSGFRDALTEHGLELKPDWVVPGGFLRENGVAAIETLLSERGARANSLDAIVCVNDETALGALESLHRRGVAVPRPVALAGFDDAPGARVANPPLTTISQTVIGQAESATRLLLEYLERGTPLTSKVLDAELVLRHSCGCRSGPQNDSSSLDFERPKVARTLRLALIERRSSILAQLARIGRGRMVGVHDWEVRLVDSLAAQVDSGDGGAFFWELERLTRLHCLAGGDAIVPHEVLTELRLQTIVCVEVEPTLRPRVEDVFQEARLILARVGSSVAREHIEAVSLRLRHFTRACLTQVGAPDEYQFAEMLIEQLPVMGIQTFCISRILPDDEGLLVLASKSSTFRATTLATLPLKSMGLDAALQNLSAVLLLPLTYHGHRLGVAALAWNSSDSLLYEEIRELLSIALYSIEREAGRLRPLKS